jgi:hypothetical protein
MSNRLMTYPRTRRESEWQIIARHHSFRRGVMSDGPRTSVALDGVWESDNVFLYEDRAEVRGGTRVLNSSHATFPEIANGTGIIASKSGTTITISAGYTLSSANVGDYFQWPDDGKCELITAVNVGDNSCTVTSSRTHTTTTTTDPASIRAECNAAIWDKINKRHVILAGTKAYYADWDIASWTEIYCLSAIAPANTKSIMRQFGDDIYLWNSNGKFIMHTSATIPTMSRLNNTMIPCPLSDIEETETLVYGRRYTCSMVDMSESYLLNSYEGNTILQESAPWAIDENGKDYAEVFTENPVGDESEVKGVLTGGTLAGTIDEPGDWSTISNGQVKFTANSETNNIIIDFTGCTTWLDVTDRIQSALRDYWPNALCYFDTNHIVFEMPNAGDTVDYCTAGTSGTDISGGSYLNMQTGQGTITTPPTTNSILLATFQLPYSESEGIYTFAQEYTHYRLYGTADIGEDGINPTTGKGNNPELYIHIEDIPVIKSFVVSTAGDGTVTASKGTFKEYDVGSTLYLSDGSTSGTITAFTSSTIVSWNKTSTATKVGATIGTRKACVFSQSGTTVTASKGTPFDANSVGKRIFVSNGELLLITGYTSSSVVTVADVVTVANSEPRSELGGGIIESPTATSTANTRKFTDRIDDTKLLTRLSKAWCKNRFWEPLPNCDIGVEIDGFFISAIKGGNEIYETQLANPYYAGYYDPEFQIDTVEDSIQALRVYPSYLAAICSQSTVQWATEITGTDSRPEIGLSVTFLAQKETIDYQIGTMSPESIVPVHEGVDILFTNNCEIRLFDGSDYGPNLVEGKIMKLLRTLQPIGSASYDSIGGYYLWGTTGSVVTIDSVNRLPFPDSCFRFAIVEEQGVIGGIKISGDDWIQPPNGVFGYQIIDNGNRALQVIFDNLTAKYYWISTYDGPTGSNLSKAYTDKYDPGKKDSSDLGTEIAWSITYGADTGALMKYDIRHEVSNLTIDPSNPSNADEAKYDSEGFRDGLKIDIRAYCKSNGWENEYSLAEDINKDGDISLDVTPQDKAIQFKVSGNRSECIISEFVNYYTSMEQTSTPSKREMSEGDYQENLSSPILWLSRNVNLYKNLASGSSISGTPAGVTGVDGKGNSGFQISAALTTISVDLSSGSILFWADGTVTVTIGGSAVSLSTVDTLNGWTLYYATGISQSGTLVLTPSGTRKIEDLRVYNSEIDSDTRSYLYNDMSRNTGDNTLGVW